MNRSSTIGYVLILGLFLAYFYFNKQNVEDIEQQKAQQDSALAATTSSESKPSVDTISIPEIIEELSLIPAESYNLYNNKLKLSVSGLGASPESVELLQFRKHDSTALYLFKPGESRFGYTIPLSNGSSINTANLVFTPAVQNDSILILESAIDNDKKIIQSYHLNKNSYLIDYSIKFIGLSGIFSPQNRYIELQWASQVQQQENALDEERNKTTVYFKYLHEEDVDYLSETSDDNEKLESNVHWISFKQKFFNSMILKADGFKEDGIKIETKEASDESYVKDLLATIYLSVEGGPEEKYDMQLYFGPNHYKTLKQLKVEAQKIIPLGWGIFGWVNKGLVIPVFNWLSQYLDNYGMIIFLLTILIKIILFIPMFKVYQSSAKMKLLKPELDEIKEKTGGDMQKMQQEQMKLYKQAGVSPLGGCLPQLVQIPILFAMFNFFPSSIELRQESLWWAHDLSTYDSIWNFPNGFSIPFYGDHVSLFTLLMTAVTILYTYMNSQSTASLTGPMKWMMYLMPIMFLGFFNNYAAALSYYYFLATCITIIQNLFIRKFFIDEDKLHRQIQENKKKKVNIKKSGLQKRLEDMAKKRGVDPYKKPVKPVKKNKK